ncbi:MAG: cysteine desulfurase family protein [Acidimicrobiaceae bacterium]|nr:cysteine desulfurase family protein [Acidimicrobiaceae bacterium]
MDTQDEVVVKEVYLDYNGSAPLDPRVAEAMTPVLLEGVGNASSSHRFGRYQTAVVDRAREQVAAFVGGRPADVVFTAGATEANNLALRGAAEAARGDRRRILISAVEHASVHQVARSLSDQGLVKLDVIPVTSRGFVDLDEMEGLIDDDVLLVSVMAANSETGVLNPVDEIAERVHAAGALFHCDATQMVGRLPFDLQRVGADLVSISSHKICGPGGVGALIGTRQSLRLIQPIIHGGGQERGLRSGSLNVAGIVGLGAAAQIASDERAAEASRVAELRDRLVANIKASIPDVHEHGDTTRRLPNTASIRFEGADAEAVVTQMDPVAVSTGSACSSGSIDPSAVLLAMGLNRVAAFETVRFSLGRFTVEGDIDAAVASAVTAVQYVRSMTRETF